MFLPQARPWVPIYSEVEQRESGSVGCGFGCSAIVSDPLPHYRTEPSFLSYMPLHLMLRTWPRSHSLSINSIFIFFFFPYIFGSNDCFFLYVSILLPFIIRFFGCFQHESFYDLTLDYSHKSCWQIDQTPNTILSPQHQTQ